MFSNQATAEAIYNDNNINVSRLNNQANKHCDEAIDLVHLNRYTMNNVELEKEILQLFCTQCDDYVNNLKTALEDAEGWKQFTHALKGSSRGVGAWRIAAETQAAELMIGDALYTDRISAIHAITIAVEEVSIFVKSQYE